MSEETTEVKEAEEEVLNEAGQAFAAEAAAVNVTINDLAVRDLTMREVGLLITNHTHALLTMEAILERQERLVTTMMYTLMAYTRQYPLDLDKLQAGDFTPMAAPAPEHVEPAHLRQPGAYL